MHLQRLANSIQGPGGDDLLGRDEHALWRRSDRDQIALLEPKVPAQVSRQGHLTLFLDPHESAFRHTGLALCGAPLPPAGAGFRPDAQGAGGRTNDRLYDVPERVSQSDSGGEWVTFVGGGPGAF